MKRLLVGSVFAPTPRNAFWYELQLRFLRKTVGSDFDHVVFCNRVPEELFAESTVIGNKAEHLGFAFTELDDALMAIVRYFTSHPGYENYLILDSDAFPFQDGWLERLSELMAPIPSLGLPKRRMAAPVRAENLDQFPHSCAFFIEGSYLRERDPQDLLQFGERPSVNFAGFAALDTMFDDANARSASGQQLWCPLIRTNTWNPHPIVAATYGHVFYHHGAGSRSPTFRVLQMGHSQHFLTDTQQSEIEANLFARLQRDPEALCKALCEPISVSLARTADVLA